LQNKDTENMPGWINPFKQHDHRGFPDVLIPLSEAHRDSQQPRTKGGDPVPGAPTLDGIISAENGSTLPPEPNILTFEALRAEVENDLAVSGHDTAYDRKFIFYQSLYIEVFPIHGYNVIYGAI
jgi:hypothetical protein